MGTALLQALEATWLSSPQDTEATESGGDGETVVVLCLPPSTAAQSLLQRGYKGFGQKPELL